MQTRLEVWGHNVSEWACKEWLRRYRLGDGGRDGNVATYTLARQDLLLWYHVEGLRGLGLQMRYRFVHGVHAHVKHLEKWVEAQKLRLLDH